MTGVNYVDEGSRRNRFRFAEMAGVRVENGDTWRSQDDRMSGNPTDVCYANLFTRIRARLEGWITKPRPQ